MTRITTDRSVRVERSIRRTIKDFGVADEEERRAGTRGSTRRAVLRVLGCCPRLREKLLRVRMNRNDLGTPKHPEAVAHSRTHTLTLSRSSENAVSGFRDRHRVLEVRRA